jgi:alpha-L-fucosidase
MQPIPDDHTWFIRDRFGLFLHWGLYSLASRHEWVQSREEIPPDIYEAQYFSYFNPTHFAPENWAQAARDAGMKYVVIGVKHHEGFCLWDSQFTNFKVTRTAYGKDIVRQLVDAFRALGLHIGFYYSLLDWHHPDFTIDPHHPLRNHPQAQALNNGRSMTRYAEYIRLQTEELLTQYGEIDILWYDFSYPESLYKGLPGKGRADWESEALYKLVRHLRPTLLLNNRLDLPVQFADFHTPEQIQPLNNYTIDGQSVIWEACHTLNGSWGYDRDQADWKSAEQLIHLLINSVACGGNLLINVGPTSLGMFEPRAEAALTVYREWMHLHSAAIYGCTRSEFTAPQDCRLTQRDDKLYVHIFAWPFRFLHLQGLADQVRYARFLHDGSEVRLSVTQWETKQIDLPSSTLTLMLPVRKPDVVVPVVELTLK